MEMTNNDKCQMEKRTKCCSIYSPIGVKCNGIDVPVWCPYKSIKKGEKIVYKNIQ